MIRENWSKAQVACLDDEDHALQLVSHALKQFDLRTFSCSQSFLDGVGQQTECILLDIHMPASKHSGYEVCRLLRQNPATIHTPIIMVSGNHQLDQRLEAYSAGADDFISKPFDLQELQAKVERAVLHRAHHVDLECQADEARQTAFEAMTHSAEQGEITRFIEQAGASTSPQQVFDLLIGTLKNFGLNSVVAGWQNKKHLFVSHLASAKPLETELLKSCRGGRRIIELDRRMIINYDQVSLLVKNSPWQEAARYGRIKDHLCVLMSAVNERLIALKTEQRLQHQTLLLQAVGDLRGTLEKIQQERETRFDEAQLKVADLELELKEEVLLLNLDHDQEEHLIQLVRQHVQQLDSCYRRSSECQQELQPILEGLEQVVQATQT